MGAGPSDISEMSTGAETFDKKGGPAPSEISEMSTGIETFDENGGSGRRDDDVIDN
mgnify:CR=1 FL=1